MHMPFRRSSRSVILTTLALAVMGFGLVTVTQSAHAQGCSGSKDSTVCPAPNTYVNVDNETGDALYVTMGGGPQLALQPGARAVGNQNFIAGANVTVEVYRQDNRLVVWRGELPVPTKPAGVPATLFITQDGWAFGAQIL